MQNLLRSFLALGILVFVLQSCKEDVRRQVVIETDFGDMTFELFNSTPIHRDHFIKLAQEGFYDGLLFHKVQENFSVYGGSPDSKNAEPGKYLGFDETNEKLTPEIGEMHYRGSLGAARIYDDINPSRFSYNSTFYITMGFNYNEGLIKEWQNINNVVYTEEEIKKYVELGGTPELDGKYTVFGMIVDGFEILDSINEVPRDRYDRPLRDISMKVSVLE
jgi:cyclophilin family peptidyl-prolyl cis-trans isomerase